MIGRNLSKWYSPSVCWQATEGLLVNSLLSVHSNGLCNQPNMRQHLVISNTLRLINVFPTRRSFDLYSSLHQVDSRQPHSFPTRRLSTFTPLCQIYSQHFIGLATAVGRSPIVYLPRSMRLSLSFLAPYIYVSSTFLCHITRYPPLVFYVSSSVPCLHLPLFHLSLFFTSVDPL